MTTVVTVSGPSIRYAVSAARRHLGLTAQQGREVLRNAAGPDCPSYRVHLLSGDVVEVTVIPRTPCEIVGTLEA